MKKLIILFFILSVNNGFTQSRKKILETTNEIIQGNWNRFFEMLSIPNDGYDSPNIEKNIQWCEKTFSDLGFKLERVKAKSTSPSMPNHPLLIGNKFLSEKLKTILIYFHMDGQPVDPSKWNQKDPFIPILTENVNGKWKEIDRNKILNKPNPNWRIFGRSTSDDKGPPMMLVNALETLNKLNIQPKFNIKLIIDFQEEMGSPTIVDAVSKFKEKLKSDYLLIIDGPRHPSNKPTLTFGARGISRITLTSYGPVKPQHSGHFGNYAPNPAMNLSKVLSSIVGSLLSITYAPSLII